MILPWKLWIPALQGLCLPLGGPPLSYGVLSVLFLCVFSCSVVINSWQPVLSSLIVNKLSCNRQDLRFFLAFLPRTEAHRRKGLQTLLLLTHPAPYPHGFCFRLLFSPRLEITAESLLVVMDGRHGERRQSFWWRETGGRDFQGLGMGRWSPDLASSGKPPSPTAAAPWRGDVISDDWVTSQPQQRFPCPSESMQEANLWSPRVRCSCGRCECQCLPWLSQNWWSCTVSGHPRKLSSGKWAGDGVRYERGRFFLAILEGWELKIRFKRLKKWVFLTHNLRDWYLWSLKSQLWFCFFWVSIAGFIIQRCLTSLLGPS